MRKAHLCMMSFVRKSNAKGACEHLMQQGFYCLPIEKAGADYVTGFLIGEPTLPAALRHVLEEFNATDIEWYPLNARLEYQNYSHCFYYNDYEVMETALGSLIEDMDERALAFDAHESEAYEWKIIFCTREEIPQKQKDRLVEAVTPAAWLWNEPVKGDVSPTSIFK